MRRWAAMRRWRGCASGCAQRGLKLMLDFVPNHVALDHPWVEAHPEFFIAGSAAELEQAPQNWCRHRSKARHADPGPWPRPVLRRLARHAAAELRQGAAAAGDDRRAAAHRRAVRRPALRHGHAAAARGLRAHLGPAQRALLAARPSPRCGSRQPELRASWPRSTGTWNGRCSSRASTTPTTSACMTGCATLQAQPVREHLLAGLDYQDRLARFLENHDEPRAAGAFAPQVHAAAALITYATPGLRFFHQGQLEGRRVRLSPHLVRAPDEPVDAGAGAVLRPAAGRTAPRRRCAMACGRCSTAAKPGPATAAPAQFIAWQWQGPGEAWLCAAVNYAPQPGQCFVQPAVPGIGGPHAALQGPARPVRVPAARRRPAATRPVPGPAGLGPPPVRAERLALNGGAGRMARDERHPLDPASSAIRRGCATARPC